MLKFNKVLNLYSVICTAGIFLLASAAFPSPLKDFLRVPMDSKATKDRMRDALLAAEGKTGIHQGAMEEVMDKKIGFLGLRRETIGTGRYILAGEPGVNDVIRELRGMGEGAGYYDLSESELSEITDLLDNLGHGREAQGLRQGEKVSIYDIDKSSLAAASAKANGEFIEGVTAHAGIRTQNIHITKQEYDRLMVLGPAHLAARLGHETTEINNWRRKAIELMQTRKITKIGTVSEAFNESWENGIRTWIRDNIGAAKNEDRRIHARGLTVEMEILIASLQSYKISDEHARAFLPGNSMAAVLNPDNKTLSSTYQSATHEIKKLLNCIGHFRSKEYREMFIKTFIAMHKTPDSLAEVLETTGTQGYSIEDVRFDSFSRITGITIFVPTAPRNAGGLAINEQFLMKQYQRAHHNILDPGLKDVILWWLNNNLYKDGRNLITVLIDNTDLLNKKLNSVQFITELQRLWVQGLIDSYRTFLKTYQSLPSYLIGSGTQFSFNSPALQRAMDSLQTTLGSKTVISISYNPTDSNDIIIAMRELSKKDLLRAIRNRTDI